MGLTTEKIGGLLSSLAQKGDPQAAMAAGKGPVTAEWAKTHGYKQFRSSDLSTTHKAIETIGAATELYGAYAKRKEAGKAKEKIKKEKKKEKLLLEEQQRHSRSRSRRPSRERGIL